MTVSHTYITDLFGRPPYTMADHVDRLRHTLWLITLTDCVIHYTMADHVDTLSYTKADHVDRLSYTMADHIDRLSYTMADHIDRLRHTLWLITLADCAIHYG